MKLVKQFKRFTSAVIFSVCCMQMPLAALAYNTAAVSEEDPPAVCDVGDGIYGATCSGHYCDNTRLTCLDTNFETYKRSWSDNFSEEGTNYRFCGQQEIMTGISCAGHYCDNVSIECTQIDRVRSNCKWVGPYSDEQGYRHFEFKFANGMWCDGSYCDNRYYYICDF